MCERCGNDDCQVDRFDPVPDNQFTQFMIIILGDLAVKLTHQVQIQALLRTKTEKQVMEFLAGQKQGDDPLAANEIGPKFIMTAYNCAAHVYTKLEKDGFNMQLYEDEEGLEALANPKLNARFWELLNEYMEESGLIGIASEENLSRLAGEITLNPQKQKADTEMQRAINDAVDELIHKQSGNGKKPMIH